MPNTKLELDELKIFHFNQCYETKFELLSYILNGMIQEKPKKLLKNFLQLFCKKIIMALKCYVKKFFVMIWSSVVSTQCHLINC